MLFATIISSVLARPLTAPVLLSSSTHHCREMMNNTDSSPTTNKPLEPISQTDSSHRSSLLSLYTHALTLWQTEHAHSTSAYTLLQQSYSISSPPPHLPYPTPDPNISSLSDEDLETQFLKIFDIIENWGDAVYKHCTPGGSLRLLKKPQTNARGENGKGESRLGMERS
ncbi:hypothetical protein Slin15195_G123010 [Septoria linicola]|uniref:Uncharacterized protein n=1 Tax=Septoria linicola TaxID=215465 RepID=A0A9Q9EQN0_9PEZI|nr:hypothetical protein Slin15195_G123010 [Septoria linicola]